MVEAGRYITARQTAPDSGGRRVRMENEIERNSRLPDRKAPPPERVTAVQCKIHTYIILYKAWKVKTHLRFF